MKKTFLTSKYLLLGLFAITLISCSDDGTDGTDGIDGAIGVTGETGNANVSTFNFDFSEVTGSAYSTFLAEITEDVLENDVVLTYVIERGFITQIPGAIPIIGSGYSSDYVIEVEMRSAEYTVTDAYNIFLTFFDHERERHFIEAGDLDTLKIIIIKSNSTTDSPTTTNPGSKSAISDKEAVLNELKVIGVDISSYSEVVSYYGL